jgi:HK97 family phage major capsid protein
MPELRLGDIPGLTAEQKAGFEKGLNGFGRLVLDSINPHIKTEAEIDEAVQRILKNELTARLALPGDPKAEEAAMKRAWTEHFVAKMLQGSDAKWPAAAGERFAKFYPEHMRTTIASIVTGSTTYSNVLPTLVYNEILEYAKTMFWHRQECRVLTGAPMSGIFPVGASTRVTAYRRTQGDDHTASTPQMGGHAFTKLPLSASVIVTNELLEWGAPVLYAWLVSEIAYSMGLLEFTDFQTGDDTGNWNGIENAGFTEVTQTTTDEMDGIKKLYRTLPRAFRPGAKFWASGNTIAAIEALKNPAGYPYFPQPGPLDTLCGKPVLECELATDGLLFFGWLQRYHIYDGNSNGGSTMEGQHLASANSTMVYMHTNNDGGPADTNAFRYVDITVS